MLTAGDIVAALVVTAVTAAGIMLCLRRSRRERFARDTEEGCDWDAKGVPWERVSRAGPLRPPPGAKIIGDPPDPMVLENVRLRGDVAALGLRFVDAGPAEQLREKYGQANVGEFITRALGGEIDSRDLERLEAICRIGRTERFRRQCRAGAMTFKHNAGGDPCVPPVAVANRQQGPHVGGPLPELRRQAVPQMNEL
jgi:hypothetical protein